MKTKIRVAPKATKGKGLTWKKGNSSQCNANTRKFRERVHLFELLKAATVGKEKATKGIKKPQKK